MTPSGTRTLRSSTPLSRRQPSTSSPTGSGSAATSRTAASTSREPVLVQEQPVDQRVGQAVLARQADVLVVLGQDLGGAPPQGVGDGEQGLVLARPGEAGQHARRPLRLRARLLDLHPASSPTSTRRSRCTTSSSRCGLSARSSSLRRPRTRRRSRALIVVMPAGDLVARGVHDGHGVTGGERAVHRLDAHRKQAASPLRQGTRGPGVHLKRTTHRLGVAQPQLEGRGAGGAGEDLGADVLARDRRRERRPGATPLAITVRTFGGRGHERRGGLAAHAAGAAPRGVADVERGELRRAR